MVKEMFGVQDKDRKTTKDIMLGLKETIDQFAMANSVHWNDHVLRRALQFEVEGQRKKWRLKRTR